jgi:hypothetical protein
MKSFAGKCNYADRSIFRGSQLQSLCGNFCAAPGDSCSVAPGFSAAAFELRLLEVAAQLRHERSGAKRLPLAVPFPRVLILPRATDRPAARSSPKGCNLQGISREAHSRRSVRDCPPRRLNPYPLVDMCPEKVLVEWYSLPFRGPQ